MLSQQNKTLSFALVLSSLAVALTPACGPGGRSQGGVGSSQQANKDHVCRPIEGPSPGDGEQTAFPEYQAATSAGSKSMGLVRLNLEPPSSQIQITDGSYYAFDCLTHAYGYGNDLQLIRAQGTSATNFDVGFAGGDFGFMLNLGGVALENVDETAPGAEFAYQYTTPTDVELSVVHAEKRRTKTGNGLSSGGYRYTSQVRAQVGSTYILRSVSYRRADLLIAFQVVAEDPENRSVTLIWKLLKSFPVPTIRN